MAIQLNHIVHLFFVILFIGYAYAVMAQPAGINDKKLTRISHILGFVAFLTGFALLHSMRLGYPVWVWIKMLGWLAIMGIIPVAAKRQEKRQFFQLLVAGLILVLLTAVYLQ
jgi:hypothetical protein